MRIEKAKAAGLLIDVQEKLFPHMDQKEDLLRRCSILIRGLKVLGLPMMITEQYPRGLGKTIEALAALMEGEVVKEKISFSCCDEPSFIKMLELQRRHTVIICGIEAHVCVMQTVIDLVALGYHAVVVADCISSRNPEDKRVAIERMRSEGAVITTSESILFELAQVAGNDEFKAISKLVK
jgi:nicotinamidase-related amidase